MSDRAKSLARIAAVQKEMVRLSEWRLASAERACRDLAADRGRLETYVTDQGALGQPLAKAALRSLHAIDRRLRAEEARRAAGKAALTAAKQREHVVDALAEDATRTAREAQARADLAATIDAWLVARTSLP